MMKRSNCMWLFAALVAAGCGDGDDAGGGPDAGERPPLTYLDPLVPLDSLAIGTPDGFAGIEDVIALADGRVVYCAGAAGVYVVDARDPAALAEVARVDAGGCQHVTVDGDRLYVSRRGDAAAPVSTITAFDLAAEPPAQTAAYQAPGLSFEGMASNGGLLYVAAHDAGVVVLADDGAQLTPRQTLPLAVTNAWTVALAGTTLYVADASGSLVIVDVADVDAAARVGSAAIAGSPMALSIAGDTVYVGAGYGGVAAVDVGDPRAPAVLAQVNTPGSALAVAEQRGALYVADWNDVRVFDASEPGALALIATERVPAATGASRVRALAASPVAQSRHVYVGEWTALRSFELAPDREAPDIWTSSDELAFANVAAGSSRAVALVVKNEGTAPLVATIDVQGDAFSTDVTALDLAPGAVDVVEVAYRAPGAGPDPGALVFHSADPDQPAFTVPLTGNGPTLQVGDPAPEIAVALAYGGEWRTSQNLGSVQVLAYFAFY